MVAIAGGPLVIDRIGDISEITGKNGSLLVRNNV